MKKKFLFVILILTLVLSVFVACNDNSDNSSSDLGNGNNKYAILNDAYLQADFENALTEIGAEESKMSVLTEVEDWTGGSKYKFTYANKMTLYVYCNMTSTVDSINYGDEKIYYRGYESYNINNYVYDDSYEYTLVFASEDYVKLYLNYPSTAKFPASNSWSISRYNDIYMLSSWVKASNAFGVESQYDFTTGFYVTEAEIKCIYLNIAGETKLNNINQYKPTTERKQVEPKYPNKNSNGNTDGINLVYGQLGTYGKNENDNGYSYIAYYVPSGRYTVINNGNMGTIFVSNNTDTRTYRFASGSTGETKEIVVPNGYYIELSMYTNITLQKIVENNSSDIEDSTISDSSNNEEDLTYTIVFSQGSDFPDVIIKVKENEAMNSIPAPQAILGYNVEWEPFDSANINQDMIIHAIKTPIQYEIHYNHGEEKKTIGFFTIEDLPFTLKDGTHETMLFSGWYKTENLTGDVIEVINDIGNIELYAKYVEGTKGLTFNKKGEGYSISSYNGTSTNIIIPSEMKGCQVVEIEKEVFWLSNITSVNIPNGIKKIGDLAFCYSDLQSVNIPDSVVELGRLAFGNCEKLKTVHIGDGIEAIVGAFYYCEALETLYLGKNIKQMDANAFTNCISINSIYIDNIQDWLNIKFETGHLSEIGQQITGSPLTFAENLYVNNKLLTELVVPNDIEKINDFAFYNYWTLAKVTIGENVKEIGRGAFANCGTLTQCDFNNALNLREIGVNAFTFTNIKNIELNNSIEIVETEAFYSTNIEKIVLPKSIKQIGDYAFYDFTLDLTIEYLGTIDDWCQISFGFNSLPNLDNHQENHKNFVTIDGVLMKNVIVPNNITHLSSNVFNGWFWLETVTIGDSVTYIGDNAFSGCTSLTNIIIPDKVISIGAFAFDDCSALTSVTIGSNVTTIDKYAFTGCKSLTSLIFKDMSVWYRVADPTCWENKTDGIEMNLSYFDANAVNFTSNYDHWYWYKL